MPSLAVTQPYAPRKFDLLDATDRSYRQIESSYAGLLQVQAAMNELQNQVNGVPTVGSYFMPSSINATQRVIYETIVNALLGKPIAIAGTRTSATKFTPTVSPVWPIDGLAGKGLYVLSYAAVAPTLVAISAVASNTAIDVSISGALLAGADTIKLVALSGFEVTLLDAIMSLSYVL